MKDLSLESIYDTIKMAERDRFDIRTITIGVDLLSCIGGDIKSTNANVEKKLLAVARDLKNVAAKLENEYGIPIINKRITVTPASLILSNLFKNSKEADQKICLQYAKTLDAVAHKLAIDFIGGFGALTENGATYADRMIIDSLPTVLSQTERVCAFVSVASTKAGVNMNVVSRLGQIILETAKKSKKAIGCAKLVIFCNPVNDNPFMAGGFHGITGKETVVNIGISGPGVVRSAVAGLPKDLPLDEVSNEIKKVAFKITRAGELIGKRAAEELKIKFGSVDISLAPTTQVGDSVGEILELIGVETVGTHGTTAALALLTDAVKKGGIMASANVGGLSGAFIPVSEDQFLSDSVKKHCLTLDKLEAMTCISSVGLDMVAIPGDTKTTTISAIIADEMVIGMLNHKTTAVRLIPVPGKKAGDFINWGGLLGGAYIIPVHQEKAETLIWRKGHIPAPITSFRN
jgi:uncharacterized protein (UPF0210 family)